MYRVLLWFAAEGTAVKLLVYVLASGPAEHCLQRIQWLDARGGILRDLIQDRTNPFCEASCMFAHMLMEPLSSAAWLLFRLMESEGIEVVGIAFQCFFITVLGLAAKVWVQQERLKS